MKLFTVLSFTAAFAILVINTDGSHQKKFHLHENKALSHRADEDTCLLPTLGAILCAPGISCALGRDICNLIPTLKGFLCPGNPVGPSGSPLLGLGLLRDVCNLLPILRPILCPPFPVLGGNNLLGLTVLTTVCNLIPVLKPIICDGGSKNSTCTDQSN